MILAGMFLIAGVIGLLVGLEYRSARDEDLIADLKSQIARMDGDGNGRIGGSRPRLVK